MSEVPMFLKQCPKCGGDVVIRQDDALSGGHTYRSCLQCGWLQYLGPLPTLDSDSRNLVSATLGDTFPGQ